LENKHEEDDGLQVGTLKISEMVYQLTSQNLFNMLIFNLFKPKLKSVANFKGD